jgi:oligosaccharide repeat unit polymerase
MKIHRLEKLSPTKWFLWINVFLAAICLISTDNNFLHWQVPKDFNLLRLLYYFFLVACLVVGTLFTKTKNLNQQNSLEPEFKKINFAYWLLVNLMLVGYLFWIFFILERGGGIGLLMQAFSPTAGTYSRLNQYVSGVAGITSLTQFGPGAAALAGYFRAKDEPWKFKVLIIWVPALFRAVINAERIAIIEVVIPFFIMWFLYAKNLKRPKIEISIAVGLAVTYIAVAEYTRSWLSYYSLAYHGKLSSFLLERIQGYYVTSVNNGFLLIDHYGPGPRAPFGTFDFFFRFPVIKNLFRNLPMSGLNPAGDSLSTYGSFSNPGFNNPNGLLVFVIDWGWLIAPIAAVLLGIFVSIFYQKAIKGDFAALVYFSSTFYGFIELPRYLLWANSRSFLYLITFLILRNLFSKQKLKSIAPVVNSYADKSPSWRKL